MTSLLKDESFIKSTIPFLKSEYFHDRTDRLVFDSICAYINKYNSNPTADALIIEINEKDNVGKDYDTVVDYCLKDSQLVYDLWRYGQDNGFVKAYNIDNEEKITMEVEW